MSEPHDNIQADPDYQAPLAPAEEPQSSLGIAYIETVWRGPLPPADVVQEYENITPGAADRILGLTEKQQEHDHRVTEKFISIHHMVVSGDSKRSTVGLWFGFAIAALGIICGTCLGLLGREWLGGVIAGVPLTYLVGVFVYGSKVRRDERNRNATIDFPE